MKTTNTAAALKTLLMLSLAVVIGSCSPQQDKEKKEQKILIANKPLPATVSDNRKEAAAPTGALPTNASRKKDKTNYKRYVLHQQQISKFKFAAFPVREHYSGHAAPLDLVSHEDARYYRKTITRGLKAGSNFAGKYTLVTIECGTNCQEIYIIETQTGKVVEKMKGALGVSYRVDSRLLILNPPVPTANYNSCPNCEPVVYVMENGLLYKAKFIK